MKACLKGPSRTYSGSWQTYRVVLMRLFAGGPTPTYWSWPSRIGNSRT